MKKLISLILALCMLCTLSTALAEEAPESAKPRKDGVITVSVDGEDWDFYLEAAKIYKSMDEMWITWYAFNPRGETYYKLQMVFSDDVKPGKYKTSSSDVRITLTTDDMVGSNGGIQNFNAQYMTGSKTDGTVVIESRSSDWQTYSGSFDVDVKNSEKDTIHIECDAFEFTLGEEKELPYDNDWDEDAGSLFGPVQNKPFF